MTDKETTGNKNEPAISYRTPIYLQLREIVRSKIEDGEYPPGTAIPSENELADTYGINRITVRNALNALVNEGMLFSVQGKGVFVVGNKVEQSIEELGGFVPSMNSDKSPVNVRENAKILREAGDKFADVFGIRPGDPIFSIRQIRLSQGEPLSLEEIYVPKDVLPQLEMVNSSVFTMPELFSFYGVEIGTVWQNLEIVEGSQRNRHMLDVPPGVALLKMTTTRSDASGRVVEYSQLYSRSDKVNFSVQLQDTK